MAESDEESKDPDGAVMTTLRENFFTEPSFELMLGPMKGCFCRVLTVYFCCLLLCFPKSILPQSLNSCPDTTCF